MNGFSQSAGIAPASAASLSGAVPRSVTRDGSVTVTEVIDLYFGAYEGRDTTRVQRLGWWRDRLGHVTLADLDDDMIFDAMESLATRHGAYYAGKDVEGAAILRAKRKPLSPATQNRYLSAVSAILTWAQRRRITPKGWIHPCRAIELKPEKNARVRFLTDAERGALLTAARASKWDRLYLFVLAGLTTGARRGELENLRWRDVDLERGEAAVDQSKNGDRKTLPLVANVIEELRKFEGAPDSLIFSSKRRPGQPFNLTPAWKTALEEADIKNFKVHDLRHDCASTLAKAGASLLEIGDLLGHRQQQVTKRYAHLCVDHKKALVRRVLGTVGDAT